MQWLNTVVEQIITKKPEGEIIVSSGVSPSGKYHLGTLREVLTAEAIVRSLKKRGRHSRHLHVVDDLDTFRKIPAGVPVEFDKYLGMPLCDVPAPDGSKSSYADYYLTDLLKASKELKLDMEIIRAHEKYRSGFFVSAIEKVLQNMIGIKEILENISGRTLDENWSPIQVLEEGYLKNREFVSIDTSHKQLTYIDKNGHPQVTNYKNGEVKLNWRVDWPARWWLLDVVAEPFGRDHASKGGSYDTGAIIVKDIFATDAPVPIPYNFINRTGETKKMSKSSGDTITAAELLKVLPSEIVWYFILRHFPDKQLFFDAGPTLIRLFDEFAELAAKPDKSESDKELLDMCTGGLNQIVVSRIPFSHLVASYQAALRNVDKTLDIIRRTEHAITVDEDETVIRNELIFIQQWLDKWAEEESKFSLQTKINPNEFSDVQKQYLRQLADKIKQAPDVADGEWFHKTIYDLKETAHLDSKELFSTLYRALIGKESGPRAGWFLSILPREWLIKRLYLEA